MVPLNSGQKREGRHNLHRNGEKSDTKTDATRQERGVYFFHEMPEKNKSFNIINQRTIAIANCNYNRISVSFTLVISY